MQVLQEWQARLERFKSHPEVAKHIDLNTALGISFARIATLEDCIKELAEYRESLIELIYPAIRDIMNSEGINEEIAYKLKYLLIILKDQFNGLS